MALTAGRLGLHERLEGYPFFGPAVTHPESAGPIPILLPMTWMHQVFQAGQANAGGVVRRSIHDVERIVGLAAFVEECRTRHFHVIETGDQLVVLCHEGSMVVHC